MPKKQDNKNPKSNIKNIKVKKKKTSGLANFIERPIASEEEVKEFENYIAHENKNNDIKDNLSEIYKDKKGNIVDVKKVDIKRKSSWILRLFKALFILVFLALFAGGVYYYLAQPGKNMSNLELTTQFPQEVNSGQEFLYTINYKNISKNNLNNVYIEVNYPQNFVFLDSSIPPVNSTNTLWEVENLESEEKRELEIKGKIINKKGLPNIFKTKTMFTPENFSSEFKEETTDTVIIDNLGFTVDLNNSNSASVGSPEEVELFFDSYQENYMNGFELVFETSENVTILEPEIEKNNEIEENLEIVKIERNTWKLKGFDSRAKKLNFKYKITEKQNEKENITLKLKQNIKGQDYIFWEKTLNIEVLKSDLNLNLIMNGSKDNQPINFSDKLNYSLVYYNKGENSMENVNIMAVINSDYIDWSTLEDENNGIRNSNTIVWTPEQILALEEIKPEEEGTINFSVSTKDFEEVEVGNKFEIKSYAKFNISNTEEEDENVDNKSNTIINTFNSNLSLNEEVRYFTKDNVPVGSGPIPPKVGEKTTFKIYWSLSNNLHELEDVKVELNLPEYIIWEDHKHTLMGDLTYYSDDHKVVWEIEELPVSDYTAQADFNVSLTPTQEEIGKIMIISPGSNITATDSETQDTINSSSKAKTTKLEDDEIAQLTSDGIIEN